MATNLNEVKKQKVSENVWALEYNGQKYQMYRDGRDYFIVDNDGEKVVRYSDSMMGAIGRLKRENPTEEAKAEYEQFKAELAKCQSVDEVNGVLDRLQDDAQYIGADHRRGLKWEADRLKGQFEERDKFIARRDEVRGQYFLHVGVKLNEAGEWEPQQEVLIVIDTMYHSRYLLIEEAEISIEDVDAKLEENGVYTLGQLFQMTPRDLHDRGLEELKESLPVYGIDREKLTDGMTTAKRNELFTHHPVRDAGAALIMDKQPTDRQIQKLINDGKELVRKDIREEFARVKAIFFDLQNADGDNGE